MASRSEDSKAFEEVSSYLSKVQDLLSCEQDKARAEREQLERDFPTIQQFQKKRIKLNVGGQVFMTTLETLRKDPDSMLASMFSGRFEMTPDDDGAFFIDRDPTYFRFILNFLRTGKALLPESTLGKEELKLEAEFYNIRAFLKAKGSFLSQCSLLNVDQQASLAEWLDMGGRQEEGQLIYKATRDGFSGAAIHRCCDHKGETITVIKTTNGYLFGGYTDVPWKSEGNFQSSPKTFLFTFNNYTTGNTPLKMNVSDTNTVFHGPSNFLWFGCGGAIGLTANNTLLNGTSNWYDGKSYKFPPGTTNNHWLVGEETFEPTEIEVFSLHI